MMIPTFSRRALFALAVVFLFGMRTGAQQPSPGAAGTRLYNKARQKLLEGKQVFSFAAEVIPEIVERLCGRAGIGIADVDFVVPHQANVRIIDHVSKKLAIPRERFLLNLERLGNTSAASVPLALDEHLRNGTIRAGSRVLVIGFGGGLSWGGLLMRC